jgi:serine/threonine protein kinase
MWSSASAERTYALHAELASGGMATVHLGRVVGSAGFARTVAVKRLHAQFAKDPDFLAMFLDEARLAARVQHPNVVATLDVGVKGDEVFLVMEYVHGESVSQLLRASRARGEAMPVDVAVSIASGVLHGLHAAHEAKDENGEPLMIVHRDVSPHNVLVGADGISRVFDFGIAKAVGQQHSTREGQLKGKLPYMPPEQLRGSPLDRRADLYSVGAVLWELLTGRRLFDGDNEGAIVGQVLNQRVEPPSRLAPQVPAALDEAVLTALSREPSRRFATARRMALALESASPAAGPVRVGEWLEELAGDALARRTSMIARIESGDASAGGGGDAARASGPRLIEVTDTLPMTRHEAGSSRGKRLLYALTLVAAALAVGSWFAFRASPAPLPPSATASPPPVDTPAASVSPQTQQEPPTASPATVDTGRLVTPVRPARVSHPAHPSSSVPAKAQSAACNPPFTWESGVKVPKLNCPLD